MIGLVFLRTACLITYSHGSSIGWLAPAIEWFRSDKSPLDSGVITTEEISWIGGTGYLGAVFGVIISSFESYLIGCKRTLAFLAVPTICAWLFIISTRSIHYVIVARLLTGWTGGGAYATTPLYVADIADPWYVSPNTHCVVPFKLPIFSAYEADWDQYQLCFGMAVCSSHSF